MILLVSDLHLGKGDERGLADLKACIDSFSPDLSQVVFLGDTFDAFVEYPGMLPEPVKLWSGFASELQRSDIDVSYFAGNHDRWHLGHNGRGGHIESVLKIPVLRQPTQSKWRSHRVWLEHGDSVDVHSWLVAAGRSVSDHPIAYDLFRMFLPFGGGHWLAAWISRNATTMEPNPRAVDALRAHAAQLLEQDKSDLVFMGHCHRASIERLNGGIYANTGDWNVSRSFLTLSDGVRLYSWDEKGAQLVQEELFSTSDNISEASRV